MQNLQLCPVLIGYDAISSVVLEDYHACARSLRHPAVCIIRKGVGHISAAVGHGHCAAAAIKMIGLEEALFFLTNQSQAIDILGHRTVGRLYQQLRKFGVGIVGVDRLIFPAKAADTNILCNLLILFYRAGKFLDIIRTNAWICRKFLISKYT